MNPRMKWYLAGTMVVAVCLGGAAVSNLLAQRSAPPEWSRTRTGLVDVAVLTQNSARLKQSLEGLKQQFEASGQQLRQEGERGQQLTEELQKLAPNSPQRKQLEQQLVKMRADFELHGKQVTNDTKDREAKLYYAFSRELQGELHQFAQATGVQLILRYDPPPAELNEPRAVLHEIQKLVVYQRGLELTPTVQEAMNRRAGANTATRRPPAQTAPRGPVQR